MVKKVVIKLELKAVAVIGGKMVNPELRLVTGPADACHCVV